MTNWKDKIRNEDCELCPLHESAEYVCLMGSGKKEANVVIVGEAPGAREDEEHRAFVGSAGQLLNELLEQADLARESCYITNAAKCRPPDNRTPTRGEIKTCAHEYLVQEIEKVGADNVLLLGNAALQAVTGRSGITKHRGKLHKTRWGDAPAFATYHPAAALRNPRLEPEIRADFVRFGRMVRREDRPPKTRVKVVRTAKQLKWLISQLNQATVIAYDIETHVNKGGGATALEDWHGDRSRIVSLGFSYDGPGRGDGTGEAVVVPLHHSTTPFRDPDRVLHHLKGSLERWDCKYVAHNGKFDARWLARKGVFVNQTFDTMLAAHLLDENRSKSLEVLSSLLLGTGKKDDNLDKSNLYSEPLRKVCIYNGYDCDLTLRLYYILREQLIKEPRLVRVFQKLMMPASNSLTKVERAGIYVNEEEWGKAFHLASSNEYKIRQFMVKYAPWEDYVPHSPKMEQEIRQRRRAINYNSPKQLAQWLFEDLDLPILEETKTGQPSTKESVLLKLSKKHPVPKAILKYRKWDKYKSTFLTPWRYSRDDTSRIHPTYKLFGTVTGRLSCVDPNLQQVPRDRLIRGCLGASPGYVFVEADYSQIELRVAAMLAREGRMLRRFLAGEDIHRGTAVDILGKRPEDIEPEERKAAKAVNFGFLYGMGAKKFVSYAAEKYDVDYTDEEAEEVRRKFFDGYPALMPWHDRQRRLAERYGRVYSPIGRIRHLPDVRSRDKEVRAEALRQAINSPVQSFASDLMLLSLVRLDSMFDTHLARIVGTVHDALLFEVLEEYVDEVCGSIKAVMEDLVEVKQKFGVEITVPLVAELKVGQQWGRCEPWTPV